MSREQDVLNMRKYASNLELLSQQMRSKFGDKCVIESAAGSEAFRIMSQIDETAMIENTTRAMPAVDVDMVHDGRWVNFRDLIWGRVVDKVNTLQSDISPQGKYVQSAVAAYNRKQDQMFLASFFGTSKTGKDGTTNTIFDTNNVVAVDVGGASGVPTGMNVAKFEQVIEKAIKNELNLDMEGLMIGMRPENHRQLKSQTVVTSGDFNNNKIYSSADGILTHFNGVDIIVSNLIPLDGNGYARCPVWVKSGMAKGVWQELQGVIRKRSDLAKEPDYVEAYAAIDFTRVEEAKCFEIKANLT